MWVRNCAKKSGLPITPAKVGTDKRKSIEYRLKSMKKSISKESYRKSLRYTVACKLHPSQEELQFMTTEAYPPMCIKARIKKGAERHQSHIPGVCHSTFAARESPLTD